jgi:hypothetical protein
LVNNSPVQINTPNKYYLKEDGSIKKVGCKSPSIFFPTQYTSQLASLIEALKVEGYWKDGFGSICNSNKLLIDRIQLLLENLGIHVTRSLILKVKVDSNVRENEVKVLRNGVPVRFYMQKSPFNKMKLVVFRAHEVAEKYFLIIGKSSYNLSIKIHRTYIETSCELPAFIYIDLRFRSLTFTSLLKDAIKENGGKKSRTIRLNMLLKRSPPSVIVAVFGMVVDCEGSVNHYKLFRRIKTRMVNREYLEDWLKLLNHLGIYASIFKDGALYALRIEGAEDFRKLVNYGFSLHHSIKRTKFQKLLCSYKRFQISRGSALTFYSRELRKIGHPVTARELASAVRKSKRVVNQYLKILEDKNLVQVDKTHLSYLYSPA